MELTPLRYFIAIARAGHMTQAARTLGVTQPALSAMLRKLETEAGAELLHRTGRGVDLTEAGRIFLRHAEDAVRGADSGIKAVRELVGLQAGSIRVGGGATATTYLLPRVISTVRRAHPGLRFYVREAGSSAVASAVASGELDLGIVTLPLKGLESDDLIKIPLVNDELRLLVPPTRGKGTSGRAPSGDARAATSPSFAALATATSFRWRDLAGLPVVAFEAGTAVRELIDRAAAAAAGGGVQLNVVMELRSIESIKQMVAAGIGVGFVSRFAIDEGEGLVCREGKLSRGLAIVRRRDRAASAAVAEFERVLVQTARPGAAGMNANISIRPATLADAAEIGEVHAGAWKWCYRGILDDEFLEGLTGGTFEKYHRPGFDEATGRLKNPAMPFLVACEQPSRRIIGFVKGGATRAAAPTAEKLPLDMPAMYSAELYAIYIAQEWLGRRAGQALLSEWLKAIDALGHRSLCVWVLKDNRLGRGFYERCGGQLVAGSEHMLTLGGKTYAELAYGWPELTGLRRLLSA